MGYKWSRLQRIVLKRVAKSWCRFGDESEGRGVRQMSDSTAQEKIEEMVRRIVERFHPEQVILFGSYARGQAGPDSDVDLLVVMPVSGSKRDLQLQVRLAVNDIRLPKDIIVVTPDQVERQRDIPGTIIRPAFLEGKVLYAKAG